jgi:replicative DNA helicase
VQAVEAEQELLAICVQAERVPDEVAEVVKPAHLTVEPIRRLYAQALLLDAAGAPVNTVTLLDSLGAYDEATREAALAANVGAGNPHRAAHYAGLVVQCARLRRLAQLGSAITSLAAQAEPRDVDSAYEDAVALLFSEHETTAGGAWVDMSSAVTDLIAEMQERFEAHQSGAPIHAGATTGIDELDDRIEGYQPGHLYVLGAVSGGGKTAWGGFTAWRACEASGRPVLYVSVEVNARDMAARLVAMHSGVDLSTIRSGNFVAGGGSIDHVVHGVDIIRRGGSQMRMAFRAGADAGFVEASVRRAVRSGEKPALVVVDYLQRLRVKGRSHSREREVAEISGALLETAQRHEVPVLALAQLNREHSKRQTKEPVTSDLRESSAIEHDASVVMFLHRPVMFDEGAPPRDASILVRKNRNGPCGRVDVQYEASTGRFWS